PRRGRAVALAAGGAALLLAAAGTVWALRTPQGAEAEAEAEAPGGITEAGCLDGTGFPEPPGEITSLDAMNVAFSPDGDLLAVTSAHHGLTLWDWREGEEIARPTEEVHMDGRPVFAPLGCMVAAVVPHEPDGADEPVGGVTTFDVPSGDAVERPDPPLSGRVSAYPDRVPAFSPDGTQLVIALGGGYDEMGDQDTFALVDIDTGETERTWGSERITDAAYTGDGRVVAAGSEGVTLWDTGTGENLRTESHATPHLLDPLPGTDEVVHVDGDYGHMVRWDLEQRTETDAPELGGLAEDPYTVLTHVTLDPERQRVHVGWVTDEEGLSQRYLAQSSGAEYTNHGALWDLESGEDLMADRGEHQLARPLALHPDGDVIAAIAQNGDVNLVDADTLEIMHPLR
ncbi:WD40 repeat domain-containing protein, partial [Nocardiopsis nanhaiensis]